MERKVPRKAERKEVTFTKEEYENSLYRGISFWEEHGAPVLWIEQYNDGQVKAYTDIAYDQLKLVVDNKEVITNENIAINGDYVMLSAYYGDDYGGGVFKRRNS